MHNECFVIITHKLLLGSPNHGGRDGRGMKFIWVEGKCVECFFLQNLKQGTSWKT